MLVTRENFNQASKENQEIFLAIEDLLTQGIHKQYGKLLSVADEVHFYTYVQEKAQGTRIVRKEFIDEKVHYKLCMQRVTKTVS